MQGRIDSTKQVGYSLLAQEDCSRNETRYRRACFSWCKCCRTQLCYSPSGDAQPVSTCYISHNGTTRRKGDFRLRLLWKLTYEWAHLKTRVVVTRKCTSIFLWHLCSKMNVRINAKNAKQKKWKAETLQSKTLAANRHRCQEANSDQGRVRLMPVMVNPLWVWAEACVGLQWKHSTEKPLLQGQQYEKCQCKI